MSEETMMSICPRCGSFKVPPICRYCNLERIETEISLSEAMSMSEEEETELIERYTKTIIKDTYNAEVAKLSKEWHLRSYSKSSVEIVAGPSCPYCKSHFITKITFFDRLLDTTICGLASDIIGKTHKCDSCGSTW